jgi:hypothetical protein
VGKKRTKKKNKKKNKKRVNLRIKETFKPPPRSLVVAPLKEKALRGRVSL